MLAFATALCVAACIVAASPARALAGTFEVDACYPYTTNSGVFQHASVFGIDTFLNCTGATIPGETFPASTTSGMALWTGPNKIPAGTRAYWYTRAPSGLRIVAVTVPQFGMASQAVNDGSGWGGGFFWDNGGAETHDNQFSFGSFMKTSTFGWQIICGWSTCNGAVYVALLQVTEINLYVQETTGPSITATSPLYFQTGWIRGNGWPLTFRTDDPSGVCHAQAAVGSTVFQGASSVQNHAVYHQCSVTSFSQTVSTTDHPNGPVPIALEAYNAAGNWATPTSTVHVDNSPVALTLSGPTDVPSTAGTEYITASASAGPSGVSGIRCTLDGAPSDWYPGSMAHIPVSGLGVHEVTCYAANNAKNVLGQVATSAPRSWMLRIGEPTVIAIGFTRIANKQHCRKVRVTARHRTKVKLRCRPGTKQSTKLRVPHGRGATVSGWLGTANGTALAGQPVTIYSAPDNGLGKFAPVATATTASNGTWSALLGPGPSRLVEVGYNGSATMEPAISGRVRLVVPAKVELRVRPRHSGWGTRLTITGRILGGYVPTDRTQASQLLKIRIGVVGIHGLRGDVGVPDLRPDGRFHTTFCLATGRGVVPYWFRAVTLFETNYPYERGSLSNRARVTVGPRAAARHRACG
jgi:hypothetical protein